jgi:signal transduction histidine kinase
VREGLGITDLNVVVRERVEYWRALAEDQGRELRTDIDDDGLVARVDHTELASALDGLIGNVFDHTPEGTPLLVALRRDGEDVVLTVEDAGPGFSDVDAALARGRSGGGSTGLGLDIGRRFAESASGSIALGRSQLGGAEVALRIPSAA